MLRIRPEFLYEIATPNGIYNQGLAQHRASPKEEITHTGKDYRQMHRVYMWRFATTLLFFHTTKKHKK